MSVPGSNLLAQALTALGTNDFIHYKWLSKGINAAGKDVNVYALGVTVSASIQAVPRSNYKQFGFDYKSSYIAVWTTTDVKSLTRLRPDDQIAFEGRRFNLLSESDWIPIDGWGDFMAVDIGADAGDP